MRGYSWSSPVEVGKTGRRTLDKVTAAYSRTETGPKMLTKLMTVNSQARLRSRVLYDGLK